MANTSLTKENIKYIRDAFWHFFPEDTIYSADKPYVSGEFNWKNRRSFIDFVYRLTGVQIKSEKDFGNIKKAELAVEELVETEKNPEANRPTKEQLETLEGESEKRKESQQKATIEAKKSVGEAIEKQQEIYAEEIQKAKEVEAALKNQKVYYKIEKAPVEENQEIINLKQQAQADPKRFIKDATNQFKDNPNLKNLTANEARVISQQVAVTTYDVLTDNSPIVQVAVINKITSDSTLLNKIVPDSGHQKSLKDFVSVLIEQKRAQFELAEQFANISKIDGISGPENIIVEISETPKDGFKEFDLNQQIVSPHLDNLNQQNLLLNNLKGFGEGEIKSQILSGVGNRLESYVAKLPTNSLLAKTYNSEIVQLGLSSLGIVEAVPWVAVEGSWLGKIAVGSGFGNLAGFIQAKTGINLGVKLAAKVGAETAVKAGATTVVKTGFKAAFSKITAALGSAGGPIGTVLAWLGGELLVKIAEKIPWKKILPFLVGGAAFLVAGPIIGVAAGIGTLILVSGGIRAVSLGGIGAGIAGFFGALGGVFLGVVGMPILITLLVFPVVVALILFIINSGAYIVPPTSPSVGQENPYMDLTKTVSPECRNRIGAGCVSGFPDVTYTVTIHAKKGVLTNIKIANEYTVSGSSAPVPNPDVPEIAQPPESISPTKDYSFQYTISLGSGYNNSIVTDIVTVTADTAEASGFSAATSASVITGVPPIDCPVVGGIPLWLSYVPGDESSKRHGNNAYWNQSGGSVCRYPLPQVPGCFGPTDPKSSSNLCYGNSQGTCSYYGYSLDIFPSGSINTPVLIPRVAGKSLTWLCAYAFANGNAGSAGHTYRCQSGEYTLNFTHMNFGARIGTLVSGDKLGEMYPLPGGAHVHLEFAINGQYQRPENYFCSK